MKHLIKVDFKAKLVQNFSNRNSKKNSCHSVCHFSVNEKTDDDLCFYLQNTVCVNPARVEKHIVFIFLWILNSIAHSILV